MANNVSGLEYPVDTDLKISQKREELSAILEECLFHATSEDGEVVFTAIIGDDICGVLLVGTEDSESMELEFDGSNMPNLYQALVEHDNVWRKQKPREKISVAKDEKGRVFVPAYLSIEELKVKYGEEFVLNMVADVQYQYSLLKQAGED